VEIGESPGYSLEGYTSGPRPTGEGSIPPRSFSSDDESQDEDGAWQTAPDGRKFREVP
ncbi:unnamed protein product, partial [marine sediment metagenome]